MKVGVIFLGLCANLTSVADVGIWSNDDTTNLNLLVSTVHVQFTPNHRVIS